MFSKTIIQKTGSNRIIRLMTCQVLFLVFSFVMTSQTSGQPVIRYFFKLDWPHKTIYYMVINCPETPQGIRDMQNMKRMEKEPFFNPYEGNTDRIFDSDGFSNPVHGDAENRFLLVTEEEVQSKDKPNTERAVDWDALSGLNEYYSGVQPLKQLPTKSLTVNCNDQVRNVLAANKYAIHGNQSMIFY